MKKFKLFVILSATLIAALLAGGCAQTDEPVPTESARTTEKVLTYEDRAEEILSSLTLRQKVGQLFIIRPDALETSEISDGVTELSDGMADMLEKYPVGGVAMFGKNITSPEQITSFNKALQDASEIPLIVSVDEEGGLVARLANSPAFDLPVFESAGSIGAEGDVDVVFSMGEEIGSYLKKYGFNMDFAPVADVNTNPENPVIGTRAFSPKADVAAEMAAAMADGLRSTGITPVFKHFPGHGDTAEDSHLGIAVSHKTKSEMEQCEWLPFEEAVEGDCIMVGHIAVPEVTGDSTPSTMSYEVVTEILKNQLDFSGLIITDSLEMKAVTDSYGAGGAAKTAFLAGCDILLMPENLEEAFGAVMSAVEDGEISEERLDDSVRRILIQKLKYIND